MGSDERRRERLRRYLTEVVTGENVSLLDDIFGEIQTERRWGSTFDSLDEVKAYHERMADHFDDLTVEVESILVDGSEAAARSVASGHTVRDWFDVVPAGHDVEFRMSTHAVFDEDGLIVEIPSYFDSLEMLPESSRYAHRSLVSEVQDAVVVLDEDGIVTDLNEAATVAFAPDREPSAFIGAPVTELLGPETTIPGVGNRAEFESDRDGRTFEVRVSSLENTYGDSVGRALVFRDVSERKRREQKLQVLNRVLRHNLRNELNVIQGFHRKIAARSGPRTAEFVSRAEAATQSLLSTAETARNVQTDISGETGVRQDLSAVVETLAERARETFPQATVETETPDSAAVDAREALGTALWELVENALVHTGPDTTVEVVVERPSDEETVSVRISDDGPGIPDSEVAVVEAGTETRVHHGSGLGLWFAKWVVADSGGTIEIDNTDGTVVDIELPTADS